MDVVRNQYGRPKTKTTTQKARMIVLRRERADEDSGGGLGAVVESCDGSTGVVIPSLSLVSAMTLADLRYDEPVPNLMALTREVRSGQSEYFAEMPSNSNHWSISLDTSKRPPVSTLDLVMLDLAIERSQLYIYQDIA